MPAPAAQRILLIRPSALGDVCRSVPVLASLRSAYPDARIDWLVQAEFADAVRHHPMLTRVVEFPRRELGRALARGRLDVLLAWLGRLREPRYDLVIDAQGLFRSGLFARWTGAPVRCGYANAQELGWLGYTHRVRVPREQHAVDRMLALVRSLGLDATPDLRLYTGADDRARAAELLGPGSDYALLAPTSRWPAKRWPAERFAELALGLLSAGVPRVVLVGSRAERDQCAPLLDLAAREPRVVDLLGQTSIGVLMGVVERARLLVACDSAALHMGVGFGRPLVALFGPTSVDRVGPYARTRDVIQHTQPGDPMDHKRPENVALMRRIGVGEVLGACMERWNALSPASARTLA